MESPGNVTPPMCTGESGMIAPTAGVSPAIPRRGVPVAFKRWLILSQYYHPEPGAPQIRLRALAAQLVRHGCEVEVVTALPNYPSGQIYPGYRGRLVHTETIDGVRVHRVWLYAASGRNPVGRLLCYLSFTVAAGVRLPLVRRPDVVFVEAQPLSLAFPALVYRCVRGVPYIYNTPDLQVEVARECGWIRSEAFGKLAVGLERLLMKRAFCVSTVSDAFVDHFVACRGLSRRQITFLPNGADTEALRPISPDNEYAEELGVAGRVVFTYAGTHAYHHGLEVVLDAAALLRERREIAFLMVGKGPLREELRRRALELGLTNVVFGDSPFSERARLMSFTRAAIATMGPLRVGRKMRLSKVVPPLACGVPVIYVGEGESAAILEREGCGLVVSPASAEGLASAVRMLADAPEFAREMGQRGRRLAERQFSWDLIVRRWLAQLAVVKAGGDPWRGEL